MTTAGDHGVSAAASGATGCQHLGQHAAGADAAASPAGHGFECRVASLRVPDQCRRCVFARIGCVEAGLVGEDHQQVGFNQIGHQRAERVVVTKADLVGGDRVVLVDDRHYPQF